MCVCAWEKKLFSLHTSRLCLDIIHQQQPGEFEKLGRGRMSPVLWWVFDEDNNNLKEKVSWQSARSKLDVISNWK